MTNNKTANLLSEREQEILNLFYQGFGNKEIGEKLEINARTVSSYKNRIKEKIKAPKNCNDYILIKRALKKGYVFPDVIWFFVFPENDVLKFGFLELEGSYHETRQIVKQVFKSTSFVQYNKKDFVEYAESLDHNIYKVN